MTTNTPKLNQLIASQIKKRISNVNSNPPVITDSNKNVNVNVNVNINANTNTREDENIKIPSMSEFENVLQLVSNDVAQTQKETNITQQSSQAPTEHNPVQKKKIKFCVFFVFFFSLCARIFRFCLLCFACFGNEQIGSHCTSN